MAARWRGEGGQDRGARPYQEDSWALRTLADGTLLAVVADGMGGHAGGAVASKLVVDAVLRSVEAKGRSLAEGLEDANEAVKAGVALKPSLAGMGATLLAALVGGDEVRWISVGDSPLYLVANGKLERLNADHSFAPQIDAMAERGMITAEEAANHPGRHTLRDAVMGQPSSLVDEGRRWLAAGATLLLCTDGMESLAHERIAAAAGQSVDHLLEQVRAVGKPHQDNVTIIKLERHP